MVIKLRRTFALELDAVGRQFEPYLNAGCVCMLLAPFNLKLWCDQGCWTVPAGTVADIETAANRRGAAIQAAQCAVLCVLGHLSNRVTPSQAGTRDAVRPGSRRPLEQRDSKEFVSFNGFDISMFPK